MPETLTNPEKRCCHMRCYEPGNPANGKLSDWRREFAELPRDEKCTDCPAAKK